MNRVGVVDVAHSGWRTSIEAAQVSERPVVASHSGCAALNSHYRCKPDEVIRAIADTGGYIGIWFLGGTGDVRAMLDHIDHVVKKFGPDYVAMDGMGEISPPYLVSYAVTQRCNLKCKHCYSDSTEEAKGLLDELSD